MCAALQTDDCGALTTVRRFQHVLTHAGPWVQNKVQCRGLDWGWKRGTVCPARGACALRSTVCIPISVAHLLYLDPAVVD
jgi:hypothetical protein